MTDNQLSHTELEDIEDLLAKVETSFGIKFASNELAYITTFGQLCDHITHKIQLESAEDCTSQQAFYQLRNAISSTIEVHPKTILPNTLVSDIFDRSHKLLGIKKLEHHLGFKLNLLRPPHWVTGTLIAFFLISLIALFFNWLLGLLGSAASLLALWLANKTGTVLEVKTVGQLAEKITRVHYLKSRRDPGTFNKKEIEKLLIDWVAHDLALDKSTLTRDLTLIKRSKVL